MQLEGRRALITGAARGIGRATALVMAGEGADVGLADVDPAVERTAAEVRERGHRSAFAVFDVASPDAVRDGVARLRKALGEFNVVVSNAGIVNHIAPVGAMSPQKWSRELAVNLGGAFNLVQALLPSMVERRFGRIIMISSIAAQSGLHRQAGYAASKAGLIGLAKTLTLEHARDGITTNVILPGLIATETVQQMPPELRKAAIARTPARRLGRMEEVGRLIVFLASEQAGFINGAEIRIDGGLGLNSMTLSSRRELSGSDL